MYIKEILKIDNLKYGDTPKTFDAKQCKKMFRDGWLEEITISPPPANSSTQTRKEIMGMKDNMKNLSDEQKKIYINTDHDTSCLLYTSPSPRDKRQSRMPCCG